MMNPKAGMASPAVATPKTNLGGNSAKKVTVLPNVGVNVGKVGVVTGPWMGYKK